MDKIDYAIICCYSTGIAWGMLARVFKFSYWFIPSLILLAIYSWLKVKYLEGKID